MIRSNLLGKVVGVQIGKIVKRVKVRHILEKRWHLVEAEDGQRHTVESNEIKWINHS